MDLGGTNYCYAGVLLALLRSLTQGATGTWRDVVACLVACLLAGYFVNEGARGSSSRQAITPAKYDEETLATNHNAVQGRGDNITLAHPEGPHIYADT